jgi:hypothetical protein
MRHSLAISIDYEGECMLIRKLALCLTWFFIGLVVVTSAADKANFSGTWVRDAGSSDGYTAIIVPIIGDRGGDLPGNNFILRIYHHDSQLQFSVEQDGEKFKVANYDLGRGRHSSNNGRLQQEFGGTSYRTKWKRDVLVIYKNAGYRGNYGDLGGSLEQELVLSPGGNVLTITTIINQRRSPRTIKEVFKRKWKT